MPAASLPNPCADGLYRGRYPLGSSMAPVISPVSGTYSGTQSVTITSATPNAIIYYTVGSQTPNTSSPIYTGPLSVSQSETVNAIAIAPDFFPSPVVSAAYTISTQVTATPVITPPTGTYFQNETVTITCSTTGAVIYYTLDGTTPTQSSAQYSAPLPVTASTTVKAIAAAGGFTPSLVATSVITISPQVPGYNGVIAVSGAKWVNGTGEQLTLVGVNNSGLEQSMVQGRQPWGGNPPNHALMKAWGCNINRVPFNGASFLGLTCYTPTNSTTWGAQLNSGVGNGTADPFANCRSAMLTEILASRAINCYVILDLHWVATQLTLGGSQRFAIYIGQNGYMDVACGLAVWTAMVPWLASVLGSPAFNTQYGYAGAGGVIGAAGSNYNSAIGGASGFGDIVFESFNEPFLGTGTYSAGSADLTLLNGGTGNTYITNGGGNISTTVTYTGSQACLNAIRAAGATNVFMVGGNDYSQNLQHLSTWWPTDSLPTPQVAWAAHPYCQNSPPYTSSPFQYPGIGADSGAGTASSTQWYLAAIAAGRPGMFTEDGSSGANGGTNMPATVDAHLAFMAAFALANGIGWLPWTFGDNDYLAAYNATSTSNQLLRENSNSTAVWPLTGAGVAAYLNISGNPLPAVTTTTLPSGIASSSYSQPISATGGAGAPFAWTKNTDTGGSGLTLSSAGTLAGTLPATPGTYPLGVSALDQYGIATAVQNLSLTVTPIGPNAPTNFQITNFGGSGNSNTSSVSMSWTAAVATSFPVASYNVYRNGVQYATGLTALTYTDTAATNIVQNNTTQPSTAYTYTVSAVDTQNNEGPQQTLCSLWWYRKGVSYQSSHDLSYSLASGPTWNSTSGPPQSGSVADISVGYPGGNGGGFQPTAWTPLCPIYGCPLAGMKYLTVDILMTTGLAYTLGFLNLCRPGYGSSGGGADIQPHLNQSIVTNASSPYGTPTTAWFTLKIPLSSIGLGVTQFQGYASGSTITMVGTPTSGPGVDTGGYIIGSGLPTGSYVNSTNSLNGPFTMNQAVGTIGSAAAPVAFTGIRLDLYKMNFYCSGPTTIDYDNIGFTSQ